MLERLTQEYERYRFNSVSARWSCLGVTLFSRGSCSGGPNHRFVGANSSERVSRYFASYRIFPNHHGKKILPRSSAFVSPSVAEVHRYGSIRGIVDDVYGYPMSSSEAYRLVGNKEMLTPFLNQGGVLGIHVRLNTAEEDKQKLDWTVKTAAPDSDNWERLSKSKLWSNVVPHFLSIAHDAAICLLGRIGSRRDPMMWGTRTPSRIQVDPTECGAVCLGIILEFFGKYVPASKLRALCEVSRSGSNAKNILLAAREMGLDGRGIRPGQLSTVKTPAILHWNHSTLWCWKDRTRRVYG